MAASDPAPPRSSLVLHNITRGVFETIVEQAPLAIEELVKDLDTQEEEEDGEDGEEDASDGGEGERARAAVWGAAHSLWPSCGPVHCPLGSAVTTGHLLPLPHPVTLCPEPCFWVLWSSWHGQSCVEPAAYGGTWLLFTLALDTTFAT